MPSNRTLRVSAGVLGLLAAFALMVVSASSRVGVTYDELGHIVSGFGYWKLKDYRVNAENGILATRANAAPLLSKELSFRGADSPYWQSCNARARTGIPATRAHSAMNSFSSPETTFAPSSIGRGSA
jgi:hypothetical protein